MKVNKSDLSRIWTTLLSNQIYVLLFCLVNCEAIVVKSFFVGEY